MALSAPVFVCGFECGQIGSVGQHWTIVAGTPTISTATARTGAGSLRANPTAATAYVNRTLAASSQTNVWRIAISFTTLPSATTGLFIDNNGFAGVYFKQSDSKIYAGQSTSNLGATGVAVTTGQWYVCDLKIDSTANPWLIDVQVDGVACGQASFAGGAQNLDSVDVGCMHTCTADVFFDDVTISQTSGDYPIGDGTVQHFVPTADGTHNVAGASDFKISGSGTDITNATTTAYQLVDDVPLESGTPTDWINMVAPPNATDYVECLFGPAPGISTPTVAPRAVEVICGIAQAGTGLGNMEIRLNDNGTLNAVYTATQVAGTTTVIYKRKFYATAPTGGAWSLVGNGNFNNLKVQFGSSLTVDANPDQYLVSAMIEAEFAAVVAPTYRHDLQGRPYGASGQRLLTQLLAA